MRLVVHSIDVMDDICKQTNNALGLNRNGYLFVTRDVNKMEQLKQLAKNLERHGGGELRPMELKGSDPPSRGGLYWKVTVTLLFTQRHL
ncbi:hypothetical protein PF004_g21775 [Phytophthora fragariae]|uniref:Uncharacterized protein n=1 Tax=Phytophthora fragariae TaxID=53985 RepID=A0A6G0QTN0_9STRA|nr:hypothetical protein PF004_g21775 [Phytophthora fragariae]KAE9302600.1 hypothetical protein PF008_g22455 [Phytophthora fragariae]